MESLLAFGLRNFAEFIATEGAMATVVDYFFFSCENVRRLNGNYTRWSNALCGAWSYAGRQPQTAQPRVFCQINFVLIIRLIFISRTARHLIRFGIDASILIQKSNVFRRIQHTFFVNDFILLLLALSSPFASECGSHECATAVIWENNLIKSEPWSGYPSWTFRDSAKQLLYSVDQKNIFLNENGERK